MFFQGTGTLSTPLGAKLLRTSAVPAGKLIGLDKNYALEHICGSEVMVEYDKLIDRQIERAAITRSGKNVQNVTYLTDYGHDWIVRLPHLYI